MKWIIDYRNWANCLKTSIFDIEIHCVAFDWSNGHIGVAFDQTSSLNTENLSELVFYSIKQGISSRPCAGSPQSSIWKVSASKPRWNNVTNLIFFFQPPSAAILDWFVLFQNRYCDILKVICLDYSPSHNNKHYNDIVPQSCIDSTMLSVYFRKNVMTIQTRQLQSYHLFIWIQVRAKRARRKNWAGISNKLVQTIIKSFEESTNPSK